MVGARVTVCMGCGTLGGRIIAGVEVGVTGGATLGADVGGRSAMASLHWPNRPWRSVIVSSLTMQVMKGAYFITHSWMEMTWTIRSSVVREG